MSLDFGRQIIATTYRHGKHIHIEPCRVSLRPEVVEKRAGRHRDRERDLWSNECKPDRVPVRDVNPVFLGNPEVLDDYRRDGEDAQADGSEPGRLRNRYGK